LGRSSSPFLIGSGSGKALSRPRGACRTAYRRDLEAGMGDFPRLDPRKRLEAVFRG